MARCDAPRCAQTAVLPTPAPYARQARGQNAEEPGWEPRSVNAIFVKTRYCRFHGMGICKRGDSCKFAHFKEERKPLPNLKCTKLCPNLGLCDNTNCRFAHDKEELRTLDEKSAQESANIAQMALRPSDKGNRFSASTCSSCDSTALGTEDLDMLTESTGSEPTSPALPPPKASSAGFAQQGDMAAKPTVVDLRCDPDGQIRDGPAIFSRTKMCKFYLAGKCVKHNACNFAHGEKDLRQAPDLSCTKMCPSLTKFGRCFTKGCTYAHDRERLKRFARKDDVAPRRQPAADTTQTVQDISPPTHPVEEEEQEMPRSPEAFRTYGGHLSSGQDGSPLPSLLEAAPPQLQLASMLMIPAPVVMVVSQPEVPQPILKPCGFALPVTQAPPQIQSSNVMFFCAQQQQTPPVQEQQSIPQKDKRVDQVTQKQQAVQNQVMLSPPQQHLQPTTPPQLQQWQQQPPQPQQPQQQPVARSAAQPQLLPAPQRGPIGIPRDAKAISLHTLSTLDTVPSGVDHASWQGSCSSFGTDASTFVADAWKADGPSLWSRHTSVGDDDGQGDMAARCTPTNSDFGWNSGIHSFPKLESVDSDDITLAGESDFGWDGDCNQDVCVRNTFLEIVPSVPDIDSVRRSSAPAVLGGATFDDED